MVEIEEARRLVLAAVDALPGEPVRVDAGALDRVLAQDVAAAEDVPPFDSSAMDGFAVRAGDSGTLLVVGESRAGLPASVALSEGQAIAISTGAVLPDGADAVVRIEDTAANDGAVTIHAAPRAGQNVRRAGEDVRAGQTVLTRGTAIGAAELGVLASLGMTEVACARRPRVSLIVGGDELLAPGQPSRPGAIRDSNSFAIAALAQRAGGEVVHSARARDDERETAAAIEAALRDADVAVICGGVSVGAHDHVRPALAALGAREAFWGLALKPGHPTWFGTVGETPVFGLPGNPVSAMVTFVLLVAPALRALLGADPQPSRWSAILDADHPKKPGRAHAVRCRLSVREDGLHAQPTGAQGSHVLSSMLGADALAILPSARGNVAAGERVDVQPLWRWTGAAP